MAALAYVAALEHLERKPLEHHVVLLLSESAFLQAEVARLYVDAVVPEQRDFNLARIACSRETFASAIESLGEELPIMAERRMVWVRDVHLLGEPALMKLAAYLTTASSTTWFLLTAGRPTAAAKTPDDEEDGGRGAGLRKLTDQVKKTGLVIQATLSPPELASWLKREVGRRGLKISGEASTLLIERIGDELTAMSTELDKLACFVGERRRIEADDVERLVRATPARRVFDMSTAIARRDVSEALLVLADLLEADEPPLRLLAYLSSHYRNMLKLKGLRASGAPLARIASAMKKDEWKVNNDLKIVDRLSATELERAIEALVRADQGIKSGKDPSMLLQMLTIHLCGTAARRAG